MSEQIEQHDSGLSPQSATAKRMSAKDYLSFEEAREFARSLHLKTRKEWRTYVKEGIIGKPPKPSNVPAHPDGIYKLKGWQGWKNWLGTAEEEISNYKN